MKDVLLHLVLGQTWSVTYSSQSICVLKDSTVDLFCYYTYGSGSVTSAYWFIITYYSNLQNDPNYIGRVTYSNINYYWYSNSNTMTITNLRMTDSAVYKFFLITDQTGGTVIGYPGVTLSVTDLQVQMTPSTVTEGQNVTLTCTTSCTLTDNPTYI
ncbi:hypothetical protein DPEC_G00367410 [Dallia pectoralis]|nr:hypothetical protein DPEC_G00367410 [Dallia pectoralis]